jgi:hypothetical protein
MKIKKEMIGRLVEVSWRDPVGVVRQPLHIANALKGMSGLALWRERGVLDDITDGVLRIIHSEGVEPGSDRVDEMSYTLVPEDLVVSLTLYTQEPSA